MTALDLTAAWPVPTVAAAVVRGAGDTVEVASATGDTAAAFRLASISKLLTTWATLIAVEEGIVSLDQPIGQPGCTLRHLLAHAGGYPFDGDTPITEPERMRIYSNTGIELAAGAVAEAADMPFADYLAAAVFEPLGMATSTLRGSPAHQVRSSVDDLVRFVAEVRRSRLLSPDTAADAIRIHYPSLGGIVPGVGRYTECPWGLGFEIRGAKAPHWTGTHNSPGTHGHFGGAGTMLWIDPAADLALVALTDREFGDWALEAWPELSDAVLAEYTPSSGNASGGVAP